MEFDRPLEYAIWKTLEGRCISCGFLCQRIDLMTETVYEATVEARSSGNLVSHPESPRGTRIWCLVYQEPLYEEFRRLTAEYGKTRDNAEINFEIITRDINCPKWYPYTPFLSPKEHLDESQSISQKGKEYSQEFQTALAINVAQTWTVLEKLTTEPPSISVVGTTPEVSQQIAPQPPAGSTIVRKRQWLNKVMDKTAAEGFEFDGYTVSLGLPPRVDLHYKRKSQ